MFETLEILPTDPILGLSAAFAKESNPNKIDLGVGVYRDENGKTPVLNSIKAAEHKFLALEDSKAYTAPEGIAAFNAGIQRLLLGEQQSALGDRATTVQTPGGCGALRIAAEIIKRSNPSATIWLSNPSWANHRPLLGNAGLTIKEYPYYHISSSSIDRTAMLESLSSVNRGDLVLLHACCHNPTGADLDDALWQSIAELAQKNGFTPFIDIAYQGFAKSVEDDAHGIRLMAEAVPELIVASSCSKNFGLYRERVGALTIVANTGSEALATHRQALSIARGIYSMPPAHGAALVATVLDDPALEQQWRDELDTMKNRISRLRGLLVKKIADLNPAVDFGFIQKQFGMFSLLGLTSEQVGRLRNEYAIYMTDNSRINIAGISEDNVDYLAESIVKVMQ